MKNLLWCLTASLLLLVGSAVAVADGEPTKEDLDFFEAKVRPVLVENCYPCHSAGAVAEKKLQGQLFLDTRAGARKGGENGPAVVPGKPDESLLISAIKHESFEMPPKGKLSEATIADLVKWIEIGAPDPREGSAEVIKKEIDIAAGREFWAFQPLKSVDPPAVDDSDWPRTDIDRFILVAQQAKGLRPNGVAEARILVRRAWFDLLGLPPTPEEMDSWSSRLSVSSDPKNGEDSLKAELQQEAYAAMIDHLLASPHYGERWARHFMDVARFAESHGYEQDYDRPTAYPYRDFLIKAFNEDMPYDQFVRWQLAGDELAPDDPLAWMATGFLARGAFPTQLTETEFESARYDELDDMVATTGVAFLGLSVGCARCHDHKFDPIPNSDYFRMAASFTTAIRSEKELDLQPEENAKRREAYEGRLQELTAELEKFEREGLPSEFDAWLAKYDPAADKLAVWEMLEGEATSSGGTKFERQDDGSYLATGAAPAQEVLTFRASTRRTGVIAFRLEALAHDSLSQKGPGRADNGNFALGDFKVVAQQQDGQGGEVAIKLISAKATHQQDAGSLSVAASIDGDPVSGWAVDGQIGRDQAAVFTAEQPLSIEGGADLHFTLTFNHPNAKHAIGRFRLSVASQADAPLSVGDSGPDAKVVEALAKLKQGDASDPDARKTAIDWFKTTLPKWQERNKRLADHRQAGPQLQLAKALVTSEGMPHLPHHADDRGFPHFYPQTYFLRRGDVNQKGDVAEQGFVQVLLREGLNETHWQRKPAEEDSTKSYRRTALANWITDPQHGAGHLAARVIVNRLWQHHFGRGLVATPSDFGAAGERPSHPELLDWLASDLIAHGWKLKRLHKLMMTSSVYMQSSRFDEARAKLDRDNVLLWRRTPRRLEAEAIRDAMLSVSGQLDSTMYGPGTLDPNMRRRSVYFFIKRSQLIPMMMLFDWPEHLVSIGQRSSTTIAPQALMFMNSPQGRSYAEAFAARLDGAEDDAAVRQAYALAFGRKPSDEESLAALEFLTRQSAARAAAGPAEAARLARFDFCQTLLSMNEFVYVD